MTHPPGGSPDRLDSWKAIADYLGRDVATVRRWESLGLPVRRVPGGRGRSVFAFRSEIDEWLKATPPPGGPSSVADVDDSPPPHLWTSRASIAAAALLLIVLGSAWQLLTATAEADLTAVDVSARGVDARGRDGSTLWHFAFPEELLAIFGKTRIEGPATVLSPPHAGVIVGTSYGVRGSDESSVGGELLWLDAADGHLRRRLGFDDELTFGGGTYRPPWALSDYRVDPEKGPDRIAVAAHHFHWWPSLVTVLDQQWERRQTFVNAGWVERVLWLSPDRLLIAGFSNARDGGMVAVLDPARMDGQSPSTGNAAYQCATCGTDTALRYVVLPRSEVNRVTASPFNRAMAEIVGDRVVIRTIEMPVTSGHAPEALYEFSPALDLLAASYGDRYWETHASLERAGRLDHPRERCPDRMGPSRIEVWERGRGWIEGRPSSE
ncbi:MAG TPA: hypothetical protein VJ813_02735 [Vicinamibacterales bacterium]|nr:hypothetical protein [Vicinamibacterales bacterium]